MRGGAGVGQEQETGVKWCGDGVEKNKGGRNKGQGLGFSGTGGREGKSGRGATGCRRVCCVYLSGV